MNQKTMMNSFSISTTINTIPHRVAFTETLRTQDRSSDIQRALQTACRKRRFHSVGFHIDNVIVQSGPKRTSIW